MQGKDSSGGYFAFQAAIYSCPNSKLPHRHLMLSFTSKVIDQLDKKRKVFQAILDKGTALTQKPKSPEFLAREVKRAGDLWKETNNQALDRLQRLRGTTSSSSFKITSHVFFSDNQAAWERYEQKRDELTKKLDGADSELENINQVLPCIFWLFLSKNNFYSKVPKD